MLYLLKYYPISIITYQISLSGTLNHIYIYSQGTDNDALANTDSYSVSDGMRRLQDFSHNLLRGRKGEGKDKEHPLEAVSLAKDVLKSHLNQVKTRKEKFLSSNSNEEALALLTSHIFCNIQYPEIE